jgi:hypothetical protein
VTFPIEGKCPVCNEFPCTNIKVCWRVIELEKDLAAAVRLLKSCLNGLSYMDRQEARAFLARLEVKP